MRTWHRVLSLSLSVALVGLTSVLAFAVPPGRPAIRQADAPGSICAPGVIPLVVPPYGSTQDLRGRVECLVAEGHRIAAYIFVHGTWWTKPSFVSPTVPIAPDGTWWVDITTGGLDEEASRIAVFAIPADYRPPPVDNAVELPPELFEQSTAHALVDRDPPWRVVRFAGREWRVKASSMPVGPGPNVFADENVRLDEQGRLHLRIARGERYTSSETVSVEPFGYGVYTYTVASPIDRLDPNVVLGLFTWDGNARDQSFRELDVEIARWGEPAGPNAQFVIQPADVAGNRHRFNLIQREATTTHVIDWRPGQVRFASFHGPAESAGAANLIDTYSVAGPAVPPEGAGHARLNLWLEGGLPPTNGQPVEVIVQSFRFTPHRSSSFHPEHAVLVDDYRPQPMPSLAPGVPTWDFDRLGTSRGPIDLDGAPGLGLSWGRGMVKATIQRGRVTGKGVYSAFGHYPDHVGLDFAAIYPPAILPLYQPRVTGLQVTIADGRGTFQVELKDLDNHVVWRNSTALTGGPQVIRADLPDLGIVDTLNWYVTGDAGDSVIVRGVELGVSEPDWSKPDLGGSDLAPLRREFVRHYAMLLADWDPTTGRTRDRSYQRAGEADNVSASGLQAAAAVLADKLGVIGAQSAVEIVERTTQGLLALPRPARRAFLWPHFAQGAGAHPDSEYSSIDTVIAALALIAARQSLGLDTGEVEGVLRDIDWPALVRPDGTLSHGFRAGSLGAPAVPFDRGWQDFGTESWLVNLGYAAATGRTAAFGHVPPTFDGSGFVDELAWLLFPPPERDRWGTDWPAFRQAAAARQVDYYRGDPDAPCLAGLLGLSAAEVPAPWLAPTPRAVYQAFGVGGLVPANSGRESPWIGHAVVVPHEAALLASLRPNEVLAMARALADRGLATPLNHVESLMFLDDTAGTMSTCADIEWNGLKGSWSLALAALGWGRSLAERQLAAEGHPLYRAAADNALLADGMTVMRGADVCASSPGAPIPDVQTGRGARRLAGVNLCGWEEAVGDGVTPGGAVSRRDIALRHDADDSELLANLSPLSKMVHMIAYKRVHDANALDFVHACGFAFRVPFDPANPGQGEGGETVECHLGLWDGADSKRDYITGLQWLVNPRGGASYGEVRVWSGTEGDPGPPARPPGAEWVPVATRRPDDDWHRVTMVVDSRARRAAIHLDGTPMPTRPLAAMVRDGWGTEVAARCAVEIISQFPGPTPGTGTPTPPGALHRLKVRGWVWRWQQPLFLPIAHRGALE